MLVVKTARDQGKFLNSLGQCSPGFEPPDHSEIVQFQTAHLTYRLFVIDRRPKLGRRVGIGKPSGHHPDHSERLIVEQNVLIYDQGIAAEAPLPQAPTEKNGWIGRRLVLIWREIASERGLNTKRRQHIP